MDTQFSELCAYVESEQRSKKIFGFAQPKGLLLIYQRNLIPINIRSRAKFKIPQTLKWFSTHFASEE